MQQDSSIVCANGLPVLGVYAIKDTGSLVIHAIEKERVQVSLNGQAPKWCKRANQICMDDDGEYDMVEGFEWGDMMVPLSEIMRL